MMVVMNNGDDDSGDAGGDIQGVSKKGNPTLACHCALLTGYINVIFAWS